MVLSNKKLKQKLRAELAESAAKSPLENKPDPNPDPNIYLRKLLDSDTRRPRLSKREKRCSSQPPEAAQNDGVGATADKNKEDEGTKKEGLEDSGKKKKIKKGKRKVEETVENGIEKDAKKSKMKDQNKKKKKKKKKQKKTKTAEEKSTNPGVEIPEVKELNKKNSSKENGEVSTKVYAGGIPYYSTEDDIRSYFESCGTITEVDCMTFPESGKFRGIAIISFKTDAAAKRALALDGADMGGLFLKIQPYKATRATKTSDFAPEIMDGYNRIYVGNLSWDITEDELKKFFSGCSISSVRFGMDKETGEFRGYAHVDFADSQSLKTALTLDQKVVFGRPVRISCAVPLKKPGSLANSVPLAASKGVDSEKSSSGGGKMKRRTCYECGEKGHISSACPNPKKQIIDSTTTS